MTPPPNLAPPTDHFLVTDFYYVCGVLEILFTCITDTPCHLYAHVADERPIIRRIPYTKRGADFVLSSLTCFVEIDLIEQTEPGDTISHTFHIPILEYGNTYYWYLSGTVAGQPLESISQVFFNSCEPPPPPSPYCQAQDPPHYYAGVYRCYYFSGCFEPQVSYYLTSCDITWKNFIDPPRICTDGIFQVWTARDDGRPELQLFQAYFYNPDLTPGAEVTVNIPIPPMLLTAGQHYAVAYGFWDWHTVPRGKYVYILFAWGLNCEYTIPPAKHVWMRRFDSGYKTRCLHLLQDWYTYVYDRNLRFKTYGIPIP